MRDTPRADTARLGVADTTGPRGMVLVIVLVVITLLALGALTFSELMMAEREGAEVAVAQAQARALADSGAEMARLFLAQDADTQKQSGGWYDNGQKFRGVGVVSEGGTRGTGRFTLVAPGMEDGRLSGIRYGMEDESGRLNLNTLLAVDKANQGKNQGRQMLMALPGMTEDVADAILDWIDLDDESREYGAELDAYASLSPPYATRNGMPETMEELLLVRGVTPALFFGLDTNRNFLIDRSESNAPISIQADNSDGSMNLGWSAYLTTFSKETNRRSDGSAKIDLNQTEAKKLYEDLESALGAEWATFIVAWRQGSEVSKTDTSPGQPVAGCEPNLDLPLSRSLTTVLDLVGPRVRARIKGKDQPVILETPFPDAPIASGVFLPKLLDNCTVGSSAPTGRVNINVASRTVLAAVLRADPTLSADTSKVEEMVDQIVSLRPQDPSQLDDEYKYETWLYTKMVVELDQMKKLMPYVCAQGCVYRTRAVGYFDRGGPAARIEVVIDATNSPPRILFWRDMTHLGRGYPLETLGIEVSEPSAGMNTGY